MSWAVSRLLAVLVILCAGLLPRVAQAQEVTISTLPAVIGLTPVLVAVDFGQTVTGFTLSDINTLDLEPSDLSDLGNGRFTFQLVATGTRIDSVRIQIAAGAADYLIGEPSPAALSSLTRPIAARPTLTLAQVRPPTVPGGTFLADFDITTPGGSGYTSGNGPQILAGITNSTNTQITVQGDRLTLGFRPTGGPVTVDFPEGFITDTASGNRSLEQLSVDLGTYDVTPPAPVLSDLAPRVGLAGDEVTVDFGEAVTGFDLDDLDLTNLSAANLSDLGGGRFTFDVTATSDGAASITVPAGAAQDASGNDSTETSANTTAVAARPLFTLSDVTPPATPTSLHQAIFDVSVPGGNGVTDGPAFLSASLTLSNVGVRALSLSGTELRVQFQPTGGPVTVSFAEGVVLDIASGNLSPAQGPFDLGTFDVTPPAPVLSNLAPTVGLAGDQVTVDFGEAVTGFDLGDLDLTNLAAANLSDLGGGRFTFDVIPTGDGPASITVPASAAQDASGNDSTQTSATTTAVAARPVVTFIRTDPSDATNGYIFVFEVSAPGGRGVTGLGTLDVPNFTLLDVSTGAVVADTPSIQFTYSGTATGGPVSFTFPAGFFTDGASGNRSFEAGPFNLGDFDVSQPEVTLSGAPLFPGDPYPVTITFSKPVLGFTLGDIVADGATAGAFVNTCGSDPCASFTAEITADPGREFDHTFAVPANVAADAAGNLNRASATATVPPADGTAPVLTISGVPDGFTGPVTATLTFDWGEDVFGFEQSDITVTGGSLGPITGGRQAWTAELSVDGTQDVTVSVAANAVRDATGTLSGAASARGTIASAEVAEDLIRDFLGARGTALIAAQPDLTRLLGRSGPSGSVSVTRATGDLQLFTGSSGPVWAALDMQWSDIDGFSTRYSHLTFGGHVTLQNDGLLGVMLQLDEAASAEGVAEIGGTGWLVGPYYVGAHGGVIIDARALWGRTENEISPFGTFTDRFGTERFLAMLNLSGEVEAGGVTLWPLLGWSYVDDRSEAYVDSLSNPVAAQRLRLNQLEAALDWTMPLGDTGTEFTGGVSGLMAREEGGNAASEGLRGRIDLGLRRQGAGPVGFDLGLWADGLGQSAYEAYGLDLRVDWRF